MTQGGLWALSRCPCPSWEVSHLGLTWGPQPVLLVGVAPGPTGPQAQDTWPLPVPGPGQAPWVGLLTAQSSTLLLAQRFFSWIKKIQGFNFST